jgi:hypothetical protein
VDGGGKAEASPYQRVRRAARLIALPACPAHGKAEASPFQNCPAMSIDLRPTEVWSITTRDGRHVRAMLFPRGLEVMLVWLVNDHPEGSEDFADWDEAMQRAEELRETFETDLPS